MRLVQTAEQLEDDRYTTDMGDRMEMEENTISQERNKPGPQTAAIFYGVHHRIIEW